MVLKHAEPGPVRYLRKHTVFYHCSVEEGPLRRISDALRRESAKNKKLLKITKNYYISGIAFPLFLELPEATILNLVLRGRPDKAVVAETHGLFT